MNEPNDRREKQRVGREREIYKHNKKRRGKFLIGLTRILGTKILKPFHGELKLIVEINFWSVRKKNLSHVYPKIFNKYSSRFDADVIERIDAIKKW